MIRRVLQARLAIAVVMLTGSLGYLAVALAGAATAGSVVVYVAFVLPLSVISRSLHG